MQKHRPHLAMEILRKEAKYTRFWKTAFIMAFVVIIIEYIAGKDGIAE